MVVTGQQLAANLDNLAAEILRDPRPIEMCISQSNSATGKTQMAHDAETPQCSAHSPCPVCSQKIRDAERERDIARAEKDTAEARVKDLEIRLKDAIAAGDSVL